jgi:hypothetical protein
VRGDHARCEEREGEKLDASHGARRLSEWRGRSTQHSVSITWRPARENVDRSRSETPLRGGSHSLLRAHAEAYRRCRLSRLPPRPSRISPRGYRERTSPARDAHLGPGAPPGAEMGAVSASRLPRASCGSRSYPSSVPCSPR